MFCTFTATQKQRLIELDASENTQKLVFDSIVERDTWFKKINNDLVQNNKERLIRLRQDSLRPATRVLETQLMQKLNFAGFVEVVTPTTLSKGMLEKMGITAQHPLWDQVYWVDSSTCLRPMLAPNLYFLLGRLGKIWPRPIRIFEIGQCFRKESKGSKHLSEFTMLNLVEMGHTVDQKERLANLAELIMDEVGVNYRLLTEYSEVYGDSIDVVVGDLEVASGATGPHPLDVNWDIVENWTGWGFGLERLVIAKEKFQNIRRVGRSLMYLDGARLNI